ncbi:MAG: aldo/keto reductase [Acidobacteriota bacterium]|nr:MAG: aldo/keto reductase [Acidobacteriota bacterium]
MKKLTRRDFVKRSAVVGAAIGSVVQGHAAPTAFLPAATDRVELGKTGITASRIAMGTGFQGWNRSSSQVRLGKEGFIHLVRHGLDQGLNFYDMADLYGSHNFMGAALKEIPRDKVVLLSKVWFAEGGGMEATDRAIPSVDRFRKELGTEMIDICLIHCVTDSKWPSQLARMRDELDELKQKGVIRATGVSCHDFGALKVAAQDPWVDVIFARINNQAKVMDHKDPNEIAAILKQARANGKAVVGMKIFGAGQLVEQHQRDASLRWVWGNKLIDAMTIGFEKEAQVQDTVDHLSRVLKG